MKRIAMELRILTKTCSDIEILEKINEEAIPKNERCSLRELFASGNDGNLIIYGIYNDNTPIGFLVIRKFNKLIYLAYMAIRNDMRSKGIGSSALQELIKMYCGYPIVVEFESADVYSHNNELKLRRKSFYLKNGFYETGWFTYYDETEFEIACTVEDFNVKEFELFTEYLSTIISLRIPKLYKK